VSSAKRVGLLWLAVAISLVVASWSFGVLYWHRLIKRSIDSLIESHTDRIARSDLLHSGRRCVPYLIRAIKTAEIAGDRKSMVHASFLLSDTLASLKQLPGESDDITPLILFENTEEEAKTRCRMICDWWSRNRHVYPAWWRFWEG